MTDNTATTLDLIDDLLAEARSETSREPVELRRETEVSDPAFDATQRLLPAACVAQ